MQQEFYNGFHKFPKALQPFNRMGVRTEPGTMIFPKASFARYAGIKDGYYFRTKSLEIIHLIRAVFLAAVYGGNRKTWQYYFLPFSSEVIIWL